MPGSFVVPLESNPDVSFNTFLAKFLEIFLSLFMLSTQKVLNKYLANLGVSDSYQLVDVYGLDDDVLNFIPKPVKALILLFPVSGITESSDDTMRRQN